MGRHIRIRQDRTDREVVGVAEDIRVRALGETEPATPYLFLPLFQRSSPTGVTIHVRTPGRPLQFAATLRQIVARAAPDAALSGVQTLEEHVETGLEPMRVAAQATAAVSLLGIALALAGIFASAAYRVTQQKKEIAIRIAIGAEPAQVVRNFAARGLWIGAAGACMGLPAAAWGVNLLRSAVAGVGVAGPVPGSLAAPPGARPVPLVSVTGIAKSFGPTQALRRMISAFAGRGRRDRRGERLGEVNPRQDPRRGSHRGLGRDPHRRQATWQRRSPRAAQSDGIVAGVPEVLVVGPQSVLENVLLGTDGLFREAIDDAEKRRRAAEIIEQLWETSTARHPGRVALAERSSSLLHRSRTGALAEGADPGSARPRRLMSRRLSDCLRLYVVCVGRARSVIFVSHRMDEIDQLAEPW